MNCDYLSNQGGDIIRILCEQKRSARKEYRCVECYAPIAVGEKYDYQFGESNGVYTYRTCLPCAELRTHFGSSGFLFGGMWDELKETMFPEMRAGGPCIEGLSAAAKEKLFAEWRRWKGLR